VPNPLAGALLHPFVPRIKPASTNAPLVTVPVSVVITPHRSGTIAAVHVAHIATDATARRIDALPTSRSIATAAKGAVKSLVNRAMLTENGELGVGRNEGENGGELVAIHHIKRVPQVREIT
jgi:hypothetical protein